MYKVIIVDDERLIRMGMKKAVPWDTLDVGEVYTAKSGKEAKEIIRLHRPQIMITDINMADMTGLELISEIRYIVPEMRIIVVTGYDKFEYARQCIKLGVQDFFLKPMDEETLMKAVMKQITYLKSKSTENTVDSCANRIQALAEQMMIEKLMRDLVQNRIFFNKERIDNFCEKYFQNQKMTLQAAILVPTLYMEGSSEDNYNALTIKNICAGMIDAQNRGLTFLDEEGRIVIAFFLDRQKGSIVEWLQELNGILRDEYSKKPKIVVGNPVCGLEQLRFSYNDAINLLQSEKEELSDIIFTQHAQKRDSLFWEVFAEMKNAMCINIGDSDKVLKIYDRFCQATDSYNLSDTYIRRCCFELASSFYYMYLCNTKEEPDTRLDALIKGLLEVSGEELLKLTRLFFAKLLSNKEDQTIHEMVDKAKRYIKDHLSEDLSVSQIASNLYLSPNYFSRLFKKVTGEGCNEYIIRKRIEKAKFLLQTTSIKTYKIALMVGYRDTNYFSLAIKKNTGVSPTKYRESYQKTGSIY